MRIKQVSLRFNFKEWLLIPKMVDDGLLKSYDFLFLRINIEKTYN